jgi:phosphoserine phosphatase RsbU/P
MLDRAARTSVKDDLATAQRVFAENWTYRHSVLQAEARVVAEEPRLKAVTAAEEVSRDTMVGVVQEIAKAIGADLFVLTGADGQLLVDAADPKQAGQDLRSQSVVAEALKQGNAAGVWTSAGSIYQVQAVRIDFGDAPFGVLVLGYALESAFLNAIERQAGTRAVLELDSHVVAVSNAAGAAEFDVKELDRAVAELPTAALGAQMSLGGQRYLGVANVVSGYTGGHKLRYALLRSLDDALAPARRLRAVLLLIAGVALAGAFLGAQRLAVKLSRPLDRLVHLTHELGRGLLSARAEPEGPREMRVLAESLNGMASELDLARNALQAKDRMQRELEIAERIQTAILPRDPEVAGLEIGARMRPASEVGGDYYDVQPTADGAWFGIGDVAGHGLTAGLIMLMVQSGVASLVRALPAGTPSQIITFLNEMVYVNVKERLREEEHVTFTLLRYFAGGRVVYAGAHEDIIVYRAKTKAIELLPTKGMWLGPMRDIVAVTQDATLELGPGDMLVLYTDGIVESMNGDNEQYDLERLCQQLRAFADEPVSAICERILDDVAAYSPIAEDDRTILVLRQLAAPV